MHRKPPFRAAFFSSAAAVSSDLGSHDRAALAGARRRPVQSIERMRRVDRRTGTSSDRPASDPKPRRQ
ncbi:hypothetical protein BDI4_50005 [Burkholderia diffusa]|nr:hypothetical protein BDI4_50005 [Burkholderia diffusa]